MKIGRLGKRAKRGVTDAQLAQWAARMIEAEQAVADGELHLGPDGSVDRQEFLRWALKRGWTVPKEMLKAWGPVK